MARRSFDAGLHETVKEAGETRIGPDMLKRALNVGFSGGEEACRDLQMALLKPKMCVLDETDSGSTSMR